MATFYRMNFALVLALAVVALICGCSDDGNPVRPFVPYEPSLPPTLADPYIPTDGDVVIIGKKKFGLVENDCSAGTANANSEALQYAIDSLTDAGHYRLELEKGDYCLWGDTRKRGEDADGKTIYGKVVKIPSYLELDLGGSTLRLSPHDRSYTSILRVEFARNVKIFNGTLIGDRIDHNYDNENSDHYGAGIWVLASMNVELSHLTIKEITGDCITVGEISPICYNVTIRSCTLSRARRDGIVATNADGLYIYDNKIFDIQNDVPLKSGGSIGAQACIAFETTKTDGTQRISNVIIENNHLDGSAGTSKWNKLFFNSHGGSQNIVLRNNVAIGSYSARYGRNILFEGNKFYDGDFQLDGAVNNQYSHTGFGENFIFANNDFYNYRIGSTGGNLYDRHPDYRQNLAFIGNRFYNGDITMVSHTTYALIDNEFYHISDQDFVKAADVGDNIRNRCLYILVYGVPPTNNVKHEWYFVNNFMSPGWERGKHYEQMYDGGKSITMSSIDETPDPSAIRNPMPDWYYESNDRAEAEAFVDRFRWY